MSEIPIRWILSNPRVSHNVVITHACEKYVLKSSKLAQSRAIHCAADGVIVKAANTFVYLCQIFKTYGEQ